MRVTPRDAAYELALRTLRDSFVSRVAKSPDEYPFGNGPDYYAAANIRPARYPRGGVSSEPMQDSLEQETVVRESAPPGREDQVRALKKKFPGDPSAAFKIAWAQYNKKRK